MFVVEIGSTVNVDDVLADGVLMLGANVGIPQRLKCGRQGRDGQDRPAPAAATPGVEKPLPTTAPKRLWIGALRMFV